MKTLHDLVHRYTVKYDYNIKSICQPLDDLLNIPVFVYYYINVDGHFVTLSNFPEELDFYYAKKMYLTNPYLVHPHLIESGYVLTASTPDPLYLKTIKLSQKKFHLYNTFLMVKRTEDAVEGFFFGTHDGNPHYVNHYLNYLELLKKFGSYFLQEAEPLIKKIKSEGYNLLEAKGEAFLKRNPSLPLSSQNPQAKAFLTRISPLSPREQQCLDLFRQGYSAQATAAKLGLSRRTVEHYFESIKSKLGCRSKWDLFTK